MSQWRPNKDGGLYVVPDVHGSIDLLDQVLVRILPLRKQEKKKDMLIQTGDVVDRGPASDKVIDRLIELKKEYPDQVIFLKGNHEDMMIKALNLIPGKDLPLQTQAHNYRMWLHNGGISTVMSYLERSGVSPAESMMAAHNIDRFKVKDLIPPDHINFLQYDLMDYWEQDQYIFVHGGCDPWKPITEQDPEEIMWDRSLIKFMIKSINDPDRYHADWGDKIIVCGHTPISDKPVVHDRYLMLDCGSPKRLCVAELHSKSAMMAYPDRDRMTSFELTLSQPDDFESF